MQTSKANLKPQNANLKSKPQTSQTSKANLLKNYLFKLNDRNTIKRYEIRSKLTIKSTGQRSDGVLVSFLLTWTYFNPFSSVSTVAFKQVIVC